MLRDLKPTDIICGYNVRPGHYDMEGATPLRHGVNFTISTAQHILVGVLIVTAGNAERRSQSGNICCQRSQVLF